MNIPVEEYTAPTVIRIGVEGADFLSVSGDPEWTEGVK